MDVAQERARRVAGVRHVALAAGQLPDQPGVDRAESQLAGLRTLAATVDVIQDPGRLRGREVGVQQEAGLALHGFSVAVPLELRTHVRRAPVLPDDRVVDRLAALAVPDYGRLALIRDAERRHVRGGRPRRVQRLGEHGLLRGPDAARIVLDPARLREDLLELPLRGGPHAPVAIEEDRARAGRTLVERHDVRHALRGKSTLRFSAPPVGPSAARGRR